MKTPTTGDVSSIYDDIAEYEQHAATGLWNAHYDRPAVLNLLLSVAGKRVLDIGCGPGLYAEWLVDHGANVVAFDISERMVSLAHRRLGERAGVRRHNVAQPLAFCEDASFDIAVAPLMIHYVDDRVSALTEVARTLAPDGYLVLSTQHPFTDWQRHGGSCFTTEMVTDTWKPKWGALEMPFWRVSLTTLCGEFHRAGFYIDCLVEPQPEPTAEAVDAAAYRELMEQPDFIAFRLRKR